MQSDQWRINYQSDWSGASLAITLKLKRFARYRSRKTNLGKLITQTVTQYWFYKSLCLWGSNIQRKLVQILYSEYIAFVSFEVIWACPFWPDRDQLIWYSYPKRSTLCQNSFLRYWTLWNFPIWLVERSSGHNSRTSILPDIEFGVESQLSQ